MTCGGNIATMQKSQRARKVAAQATFGFGGGSALDIEQLFAARNAERYDLHTRYLNEQMVRVLKTIGFDRAYKKGQGQYLYGCHGE
jgi:ornithine--oxo-acid transaminase